MSMALGGKEPMVEMNVTPATGLLLPHARFFALCGDRTLLIVASVGAYSFWYALGVTKCR